MTDTIVELPCWACHDSGVVYADGNAINYPVCNPVQAESQPMMDAVIRYFVYCCSCRKTIRLEFARQTPEGTYVCSACESES